jgi:flagellar motility protein MotE (MotC chaperone)
MWRILAVLVGVFSSALVLAEAVGIGWLWSQGMLTAQKLYEIRLLLSEDAKADGVDQTAEDRESGVSQKEIQAARIMRVLNLESREKELEWLKTMTENSANELISARKSFDEMKQAFRRELEELEESRQTAAVEQARAVLLALPVDSAVERLMALPLEEAVNLVSGMPEKSIAKILQGFETAGGDGKAEERKTRGQKIFEALSRGEPVRTAIQGTLDKYREGVAGPPGGAG